MKKPTVGEFLRLMEQYSHDQNQPEHIRLAAAREWGCYQTLVDLGVLDEAANDYTISATWVDLSASQRGGLTCVGMMDRAIAREGRKQQNRDALLLEDDGFHGLAKGE